MATPHDVVAAAGLALRMQQALSPLPVSRPEAKRAASASVDVVYGALVTDAGLIAATQALFKNRHYASAVEAAYKYINNLVKERSRVHRLDGSQLMEMVFSPGSPRLRLSELRTASQRDEQAGYMRIFAGCMVGVRNPRAHEHAYRDQPEAALELLGLANHLARKVTEARRSRPRPRGTTAKQ